MIASRISIVLVLFFTLFETGFSQDSLRYQKTDEERIEEAFSVYLKTNSVFLELGGRGGLYSLNYEKRFPFCSNFINNGIVASIGLEFIPQSGAISFFIPTTLSFSHQSFRKRFDFGLGHTYYKDNRGYIFSENESLFYFHFAFIKTLLLKSSTELGFSLNIFYDEDIDYGRNNIFNGWVPWPGFRLGHRFGKIKK